MEAQGLVVKDKMVVSLTYVLKDDDGNLIEERTSSDPLTYIQGLDQIMPQIEEAVEGHPVGYTTTLVIHPEDYYGEYNEDLVADIERTEFPEDFEIEVGAQFEIEGEDGEPMVVQVIEVDTDDGIVTVDGNHPLAGVELHFKISVDSLRTATAEELDHGHVHGAGEHYH